MKSALISSLAFFSTMSALDASVATAAPASWTTTSTGALDGDAFSVSGLASAFLAIDTQSLDSAEFSAGPISSAQTVQYGASNDWTVTFDQPVNNLMVYAVDWRGVFNSGGAPDPDSHYVFDRPFTILSGFADSFVSGNTLTLPASSSTASAAFYSGIIQFPGLTSSLAVISDGQNDSGQWLTFVTAVPEPSAFLLLAVGGLGLSVLARRRYF